MIPKRELREKARENKVPVKILPDFDLVFEEVMEKIRQFIKNP